MTDEVIKMQPGKLAPWYISANGAHSRLHWELMQQPVRLVVTEC